MAIEDFEDDFSELDNRAFSNESNIIEYEFESLFVDNILNIALNAEDVSYNMMQIAANSVTIASNAAVAIDSNQLASTVASVNATIAANSAKINTNMDNIGSNSVQVSSNLAGIIALSNDIGSLDLTTIGQLSTVEKQYQTNSDLIASLNA